jgi:hypothetical protein
MLLNSNQIANHVIESDFSKRAQIGIDLSVCKIERIDVGSVVYKDKTHIDATGYHELPTQLIDNKDCIIESPWWDPGFYCDQMNTTMIVTSVIIIEKNARIGQIAFWQVGEVGEQYDGQWQGLNTAYKK